MNNINLMRLRIAGTEKIKDIVLADNSTLLDYDFFEQILLKNFKTDSKEGGKFLCSVVDDAKEIFPYREVSGKQVNPLKNIVRGLSIRFNAVYADSLGARFRLSTHKTKATTLVPSSSGQKSTSLSKLDKALVVIQAAISDKTISGIV